MKVYISADIEGVTGVTDWDETELGNAEHQAAREQMTREVMAACEGAFEAGADEIYVKDAHDSARNLIADWLPENVVLIRGWTCTPESMMAGLDETFDAAVFIGYHTGAGFDGNPLAHTMNRDNNYVKINGRTCAEFDMNAYMAEYYNVPVVFISGDEEVCEHAKELIPEIASCGVKWGRGEATFNKTNRAACNEIKEGVKEGLRKKEKCLPERPEKFELEMNFKECVHALRSSCYPGAKRIDTRTVTFTADNIYDMMTARMFML